MFSFVKVQKIIIYLRNAIRGIMLHHITDLENATGDYHSKWSKSGRESLIPSDITHTWNLKYDTPEPAYEAETDSQAWRTDCRLPRGGRGRGLDGEFGTSSCQLLHTEWTNSKVLLYSTTIFNILGQTIMEKNIKKIFLKTYVCI